MRCSLVVTFMVLVLLPGQQVAMHAAHTDKHTHTECSNSVDSLHLSEELAHAADDDVSTMGIELLQVGMKLSAAAAVRRDDENSTVQVQPEWLQWAAAVRRDNETNNTVQVQPEWLQSSEIDPSFNGALPIEWVHVPKTGSSFLQTLLHIQGVCPGLPLDFEIPKQMIESYAIDPEWKCSASAIDLRYGRKQHAGIEALPEGGFNEGKGHFMMMMRQPEQRMLSMWNYYQPPNQKYLHSFNIFSFDRFINATSGCVAKMLTRAAPLETCLAEQTPPTDAEMDEAKTRLQTGFSFIGMEEQWDLSICLFNVMFNQKCHSFQFQNACATNGTSSTTYDLAPLHGYRDLYDTELFDIGTTMFESNLKRYNVSESSCESCWREAGVF